MSAQDRTVEGAAEWPLAVLRGSLAAHVPGDEDERRSLARVRHLIDWLRAPFDERADPTHVTGSAIVRGGTDRVLLHRHKRLGIWLQPGGHLEPGEAPWDAALRETFEETGVDAGHPGGRPQLVHVDVHEGPRGHVHLDLRYLLHADEGGALAPASGESPDVSWHDRDSATRVGDDSLLAAIAAAWTHALP